MNQTRRIGMRIGSADPYWVQLREAVTHAAQHVGAELVELDMDYTAAITSEAQGQLTDQIVALDLDVVICAYLPAALVEQLLAHGMPVIQLTETDSNLHHPRFCSMNSYYAIASMAATFIASSLAGRGHVIAVGGLMAAHGEDGRSRLRGLRDTLRAYPEIVCDHVPSAWRYDHAFPQLEAALRRFHRPADVLFGFSDSVALAARDAAERLGLLGAHTRVVGINGDPLALAAIVEGRMHATVETPIAAMATEVIALAERAARGEDLPDHFSYEPQLVTQANIAQVAAQKLIAMADLPSRLVGVNRQREQKRLSQLETSLAINRRIGAILDRPRLVSQIAELIRETYAFDSVALLRWLPGEPALMYEYPAARVAEQAIDPIMRQVVDGLQIVAIADTRRSHLLPGVVSGERVVVPVRLGTTLWGVLDLRGLAPAYRSAEELTGLQLLADQLGIAIHNADLYGEALEARARAEQTDRQKMRLLANVSHELRTTLSSLRGYNRLAHQAADDGGDTTLRDYVRHLQVNINHLQALSNDLLDLSRAEIGELPILAEVIDVRDLIEDLFNAFHVTLGQQVGARLSLPPALPPIRADRTRIRQVLLNLLDNAAKFTDCGEIEIGAEAIRGFVHLWVRDTGPGVPPELQHEIFEPFVRSAASGERNSGAGLGLAIARSIVALHHGSLWLTSTPGQGSVFHVQLPVLRQPPEVFDTPTETALLLVSAHDELDRAVREFATQRGLHIRHLRSADDLERLPSSVIPAALAWDVDYSRPEDWSIIHALRRQPALAHLPFVMFQGADMVASDETGRFAAANRAVLIVDDDPESRELYRHLIEQALPGYRIQLAPDGRAALITLSELQPALVVLDLVMPGLDGFGVLETMRADERLATVPVVVVSGHTPTFEQLARLNYPLVTYQSKGILSDDESAAFLRRSLSSGAALAAPTSALVKRTIAYLQEHYARELSRQELAEAVGISQNYLSDIFHREIGMPPWEYLNRYRIKLARDLLRRSDDSITSIAGRVGFEDAAYFSRVFRRVTGRSPRAYRDRR